MSSFGEAGIPLPSAASLGLFSRQLRSLEERAVAVQARVSARADDAAHIATDASSELLTAIEELHVAEEELRQQNDELLLRQDLIEEERQRYRELFEHAPLAYLVTDAYGTIREANRAAGELLGAAPVMLIGKPLANYVDPAARREFRRRLNQLANAPASSRETWTEALRPRHADPISTELWVGGYAGRRWAGRELRWVMRATPTSDESRRIAELERELRAAREELAHEREERAAAESAVATRDEMLAVLGHELRAPLHAIAGYTELLLLDGTGGEPEQQRRHVEGIRRGQEYLLTLVRSILDHYRLRRAGGGLEITDVPAAPVVSDACEMVEPLLRARRQELGILEREPGLAVRADRTRLQQIVVNLLSNAVRYTAPGGRISLEIERGGGSVRIHVTDSGCGIPEEEQERIFEPFVRIADHAGRAEPQREGMGLGLSISRELARAMGGDLGVRSVAGAGSTFTLTLPAGGSRVEVED
ncbi:MAG TPA: ATP-binding protein [Gemmatimonadaceae bacterium]|nr:ATP-binding protein [Gemmatimonadaceae bacterium]